MVDKFFAVAVEALLEGRLSGLGAVEGARDWEGRGVVIGHESIEGRWIQDASGVMFSFG